MGLQQSESEESSIRFLRERYEYRDGLLLWKINYKRGRIGAIAGCRSASGYWQITINKKSKSAHRIVWAIVHGEWPKGMVDHINGDKADNRIENLRLADTFQNRKNLPMHRAGQKIGTYFRVKTGKWVAQTPLRYLNWVGGRKFLGEFKTMETMEEAGERVRKFCSENVS